VTEYHKIQTVFKRDPETRQIIEGEYTTPEFAYLAENDWVFTEKVDGTNIRIIWDGERVHYGGRTDNASIPTFLLDRLRDLFEAPAAANHSIFSSSEAVLYGEGYGARIQKGGGNYNPNGCDFALFDVSVGGLWLERENVAAIGEALGVGVVPVIGAGGLLDGIKLVREGFVSQWGNFVAEGIVARPQRELCDRRGKRIITKIKHCDFVERNHGH